MKTFIRVRQTRSHAEEAKSRRDVWGGGPFASDIYEIEVVQGTNVVRIHQVIGLRPANTKAARIACEFPGARVRFATA